MLLLLLLFIVKIYTAYAVRDFFFFVFHWVINQWAIRFSGALALIHTERQHNLFSHTENEYNFALIVISILGELDFIFPFSLRAHLQLQQNCGGVCCPSTKIE